ncbi:DNA-binding response regulator [Paenibacillus sp. BIHB 4019]|uniref:DNA-binding response regulator n=1 Tax=Paenibacillus sp. BIHB 4019 TaxID=1870819 RepID=A0A1B2DJC0_9BACL|nr:helix-turn-helix domain-containing protein [Paenibacillus sp. BIHB 4019]ANY67830.1 DNA-binding response regulator [Paenibacillus sp. BIHB 4019]
MKLVLVDDEKGIVDGIKLLINRYIPECEVVGVAYNGLEGGSLIQELQPDIVITDIRMPQVSGLDMIKGLKDKGSQTTFILLSGYADFEYARRGMHLGVQSYINKPVEEEELQSCVHQAMKAIRADRAKRQEVADLKQEVHHLIQENALRDILDVGSDNKELMEEWLEMAQIPTKGNGFAGVALEFDRKFDALKEAGLQQVLCQIDQALEQYDGVYRFRYTSAQVAVVVAHAGPIRYTELLHAVQRLKEEINLKLGLSMTIGVGTIQERAAGISQSFEEARYALSYKVVKGADTVIPFTDITNLSGRIQSVPEESIAKLEAALENMDEKECVSIIHDIFRLIDSEPSMTPADLQMHCVNILLASIRKMSFQQLQQNDFLGRHILSLDGISRFRTLECLEEWMVQAIKKIIEFKLEHNIPKKKDIIAEVKEYVSAHYNEPITLADLSARFFISPYYLSQFFKQKTGETYVSFLSRIRIGKAKELLERTDLKVYEICQRVGYSDTQHFARLFEKLTGCKPSEYRKRLPSS